MLRLCRSMFIDSACHAQYKLYIMTLAGDLIATFGPDPDPGLGIRNVAWHPSGMFLAVGGWDEKVKILPDTRLDA